MTSDTHDLADRYTTHGMTPPMTPATATAPPRPTVSARERSLYRLSKAIEDFTPRFLHIDEMAKAICDDITTQLKFDFAAVQLVDFEERSIQTVYGSYGSGLGGQWHKIAKHSLEVDSNFLDIQADIALACPPTIEIITGWDRRFDDFIYTEFGHHHFTRVWVPLIMIRNTDGHLVETKPDEFDFQHTVSGQRSVITLSPKGPATDQSWEIIGTLEAGFDNSSPPARHISHDLARQLFGNACHSTPRLYHATLLYVLELVTACIKHVTHADCASLHFPLGRHGRRSTFQVWLGPTYSRAIQPRGDGLGHDAIRAQRSKTIIYGRKTAKHFNPRVHDAGINSYTAFPLIFHQDQRSAQLRCVTPISTTPLTGVLYIAFRELRRFSKSEIKSLQPFITLALDTIRNVTYHAQTLNLARQLASLHDIARLFAVETDLHHMLWSIAGFTSNILTADLVMIYIYDSKRRCFMKQPVTAGRRLNDKIGPGSASNNYLPPLQLSTQEESVYAESREAVLRLYGDVGCQDGITEFVNEEAIAAAAGVVLRLGKELIGIMFVNYRRLRVFSEHERKFVETLASTAAIAIWNRRQELTVPQIRAKAIQEVCGLVLHDFQPRIGILEAKASTELSGYGESGMKMQIDLVKGLVNAIKSIYRSARPPKYRKFDLGKLVREIATNEPGGDGLKIALTGPTPMPTEADPNLLRIVIGNGLRNAIEAVNELPDDGPSREVAVGWGATGNKTWLTIVDNGPGLCIGTPFKLGKTSKQGHSGIGLSAARLAITSMGGSILLKPAKNGGAHFEICWKGGMQCA
jgi:GAF domain-containing protein